MKAPADILHWLRKLPLAASARLLNDSRQIEAGDVFFAYPGSCADGRNFIQDAIAAGCAAVIFESDGRRIDVVPALAVTGLASLCGDVAHLYYKLPSAQIPLIGVTGTNGKTSTVQYIAQALELHGQRCAVNGTLGEGFLGELVPSANTTPDALHMHDIVAQFVAAGAQAMAFEVSSIGLQQGRVNGLVIPVRVFTNFTQDHLDYHGSMESYAEAKRLLFTLPGDFVAVLNLDDVFGVDMARRMEALGRRVIGYTQYSMNVTSVESIDVLLAGDIDITSGGLQFDLHWQGKVRRLSSALIGRFNIANLQAAASSLLALGLDFKIVCDLIQGVSPAAGRAQLFGGVGEPLLVVDYAHTPDALQKILESVRDTARSRQGNLWVVFGCGGDRDRSKRPLMGKVALAKADRIFITSDNPRLEDPAVIIDEIIQVVPEALRIIDRAEAIRQAIFEASASDVIVVAGKGHENYQEIAGKRLPFSDIEQVQAALHERRQNNAQGSHVSP